jgi:H+/Cl- antiporter ClcA
LSTPDQTSARGYLRLVLLGAAIGIPAALVAALFLALVHDLEHWLWDVLPGHLGHEQAPWYLVLGLPVVGAVIVLFARRTLPGDGGHTPLDGMGGGEPTPVGHAPGIALAALGSLPFGAVLGPEAPVIALGSATGVAAARIARLEGRAAAIVSSAGSFSAISALFGGPLVAGMLLVEGSLGLGTAALPILLPGLVAAATGYLVFVGFGHWGGLHQPGLVVPNLPPFQGTHLLDLLVGIAVGLVTVIVVQGVRIIGIRIRVDAHARFGMAPVLLAGALAVGLLAELASLLGADSQDVLFSGQTSVPSVIASDSTKIVVILLVAKGVAYAISLACGFRGGPIFPAIFLGVALATLPVVWFGTSPTLAVAVGAAAGMAAQTKLLFAPLLFASLLVGPGDAAVLPATVFSAASAWLLVTAIDQRRKAA